MLQRIARLSIAAPRRILAVAVLVMVAAAVFGVPVAKSLSAGGFQDPASESARAIALLGDKFGQSDQQLILVVTAPGGARSDQARLVATDIVAQVQRSPGVFNVTSAWTGPAAANASQLAAQLVSRDGKSGLIVANLEGGENSAQKYAKSIALQVVRDRNGVTVRAGGVAMAYDQINRQNERDLLLMESLAIPLSFLVLVWVFGGLLTAALPVVLGGLAIVGSMSVLRLISFSTDVSTYALNLSSALGLALAIDYTLLIISRYRDELADGSEPNQALIRTMATAGRTVLVLGDHRRIVDGGDGAVPDVLLEVVRLRGRGHRGLRRGGGDRRDAGGDRAARAAAGCAGRAPAGPADGRPPGPGAQARRTALLVSVDQVRDAASRAGGSCGRRVTAGAWGSLPWGEVGNARRPCVADIGVGARGR